MAKLYKVNGMVVDVQPKNGTDFSLEEVKELIGGGYVEVVPVFGTQYLCVDENGRSRGFQHNKVASELVKGKIIGDIVGDMLLCNKSEFL